MSKRQNDLTFESTKAKTPRLALIASQGTIADYSIFLHHLLVGLADESIQVLLICPPGCDVDSVIAPGVEVIRHPAIDLPFMQQQNKNMLLEKLEKFKPTVLHCLCETQDLLTKKLARQMSLPYVLTIISLRKKFGQLSFSSTWLAKVIVPAQTIASDIAKFYPRLDSRIEQLNFGTFVTETGGCFSEPAEVTGLLLTHPPDDNEANLAKVLAAVKHLTIDGYEFVLAIIGSGRDERALRKLLRTMELSQMATITPKLNPVPSLLAAGDIFIRPGPVDSFDPFLLEAMSTGSALAACKGGVDDLIIDGQTAIVFDHEDELSIYTALKRMLDSHEFAQRLAANARRFIRDNCSVSKMIQDTLNIYRQVQS
jgi:glycosyltransferase involved in cell wall biosynthesis